MFKGLMTLARPALLALDPEKAHELTLRSLEQGLFPKGGQNDHRLEQTVWGLKFNNPLGMAAGFDKNGRVIGPLFRMGFGFCEAGTVTPLPQEGNPKPRVFRLIKDRAVINRLGFNNQGHDALATRLLSRSHDGNLSVNIGANKDSSDRVGDYVAGLQRFYEAADFFTINISSPNTPGLRDLQAPEELDKLLSRLMETRTRLMDDDGAPYRPMAVKLAPDIDDEALPGIIERLQAHNVDAIVISNTTLSRTGLGDQSAAQESGGLSGAPLFERSTKMLARTYELTKGEIPLIGVGGVTCGETALAKLQAGATLIELYTGLIYEGPSLITRIKRALIHHCEQNALGSISQTIGSKADEWAAKQL
ncbi:MAG: quinone-dependent dihydroorotate dehydrogenase [Hyphomicrobiaceae bacterium]|nr:quinone-dependent dihydroorotate dehydrogenase [Hyphomicrobiaceae bacterium]